MRLLQVPRANHATAIQRSNYKNRGKAYSDLGVAVRCQRWNGDMGTVTNTLHYLETGGVTVKFVGRKQEFLLPVVLVLRALSGGRGCGLGADGLGVGMTVMNGGGHDQENDRNAATAAASKRQHHGITDEELYNRIVQKDESNTFLRARAELLLQEARQLNGLQTPMECLAFIGSRFRLFSMKPNSVSDVEIGHYIIDR